MNIFENSLVWCNNLNLTSSASDLENTRQYRLFLFSAIFLAMTSHKPLPNNDLHNGYGYLERRLYNLDALEDKWRTKLEQGWGRFLEAKVDRRVCPTHGGPSNKCVACAFTQADVDKFNTVLRDRYKYIAERNGLGPVAMWGRVAERMVALGTHADDLEIVQEFILGWSDLDMAAIHRWSLRYPERCPLLGALTGMDQTCSEVNDLQTWLDSVKEEVQADIAQAKSLPELPAKAAVRAVLVDYKPTNKKALTNP